MFPTRGHVPPFFVLKNGRFPIEHKYHKEREVTMDIEQAAKHGAVNRAFNEMLDQMDEWLSYPDKEAQRKTARVYLETMLFIFTKLDPIVAKQYYAGRSYLKTAYWSSKAKREGVDPETIHDDDIKF